MGMTDRQLQELAEQVAVTMGKAKPKPRLALVEPEAPPEGMSALQRDVVYSRIRDIGNLYWLNWLIRQETMHVLGVMECLSDDELTALLGKMERGMEARMDGVPFEEVGLVRGATCNWVA
jgi:hypothetical protein